MPANPPSSRHSCCWSKTTIAVRLCDFFSPRTAGWHAVSCRTTLQHRKRKQDKPTFLHDTVRTSNSTWVKKGGSFETNHGNKDMLFESDYTSTALKEGLTVKSVPRRAGWHAVSCRTTLQHRKRKQDKPTFLHDTVRTSNSTWVKKGGSFETNHANKEMLFESDYTSTALKEGLTNPHQGQLADML